MWHERRFFQMFRRIPAEPHAQTARLPNRRQASDQLLRQLNWQVFRPLASYLGGNERSQFRGSGVEFSELRTYQPGDDIRFIDWNSSARMEQPMVREAYVERSVDVWFLLDMSASTQWGTAACLKWDLAVEFTALTGQLLNRAGNRLGALLFAEQPLKLIPPQAGHLHLLHLLAQLQQQEVTMHSGVTDLAAVLKQASSVLRRRSLLLVVSDFLVADTWQIDLGKLAQRHEIVAVRLVDPREGDLPDVGLVTLEDPETGQQLQVDTSNVQLRTRFKLAAQQQTAKIHAELVACGAEVLSLHTDEDLMVSLLHFLRMRQAGKISARGRHVESSGRVAVSSVIGMGDA
jgi:uncharacterized protein (DUF58 family)